MPGQGFIVVGGGNSAGQAALHLSKDARCVHLVVRGSALESTMSDYLVQRVCSSSRIEIHRNSEVESIAGEDCLHSVTVRDRSWVEHDHRGNQRFRHDWCRS